jgi:uncharacterized protein YndB with AHSA1/START domain
VKAGGVGPIVESVFVPADPAAVFEVLTAGIGGWWPLGAVSLTGVPVVGLELDGRPDGLLVEVWEDGTRAPWARVTAWEPPRRLGLEWNPGGGARPATQVDIALDSIAGGTQVRVTHSGWEPLGEEARMDYVAGWPFVLDRLALRASRG